jgi:hypothetical protein
MTLTFVEPPASPAPNILLYGPGKTGKTLALASAPGPVLHINADLPNATRRAHVSYPGKIKEVRFEGVKTFTDVLNEVQANPSKWGTIGLDTVGDAYRVLVEEGSNRAIRPQIQHYGDANTYIERFCRHLCELPVTLVLICHQLEEKNEATGEIEKTPFTGTSNSKLGSKLMGMVDIIGGCAAVADEQSGEINFLAGLTSANGRRGGNRYLDVLGKVQPLDLTNWVELIKQSEAQVSANDNKEAKAA